jgi:hypothetical protein
MAQDRKYFGNDIVFCSITPKNCPYGNGKKIKTQKEEVGTFCKTGGFLEKITLTSPKFNLEIEPKFDLTKIIKIPYKLI